MPRTGILTPPSGILPENVGARFSLPPPDIILPNGVARIGLSQLAANGEATIIGAKRAGSRFVGHQR
jgi:hypothetical protein